MSCTSALKHNAGVGCSKGFGVEFIGAGALNGLRLAAARCGTPPTLEESAR